LGFRFCFLVPDSDRHGSQSKQRQQQRHKRKQPLDVHRHLQLKHRSMKVYDKYPLEHFIFYFLVSQRPSTFAALLCCCVRSSHSTFGVLMCCCERFSQSVLLENLCQGGWSRRQIAFFGKKYVCCMRFSQNVLFEICTRLVTETKSINLNPKP
jgi:hypothetical protein